MNWLRIADFIRAQFMLKGPIVTYRHNGHVQLKYYSYGDKVSHWFPKQDNDNQKE